MIELFVRSQTVDLLTTDTDTLSHSCAGPGAQMRAAAATRSVKTYSERDREAIERVRALAQTLHVELVLWDLATVRGRRAARRRGVRETPAVVFESSAVDSVDGFVAKASSILRARGVSAG